MRVGVLSMGSPDYLIDIVMDGLIRLLGREQVSVRANRHDLWGPYAHLRLHAHAAEPFDIREADVLVASNRSAQAMREWRRAAGHAKPVAFLDGEDGEGIDASVLADVKVYFKRECLRGKPQPKKVQPLPFAAIPEEREEPAERTIDLSFAAGETHPFRADVARKLASMGFLPSPHKFDKKVYNGLLSRSWIGVSVRGNGWDTYRYWETPYFGALLVAQRSPLVIPDDFKEGEEAVFFDDESSLEGAVRRLLADRERLRALARAGQEAAFKRHLSIHRAKRVLEYLA